MKEPKLTSITIHSDKPIEPEKLQKMFDSIREKHEQEKRDYEIYKRGQRSVGRGIFGGLL